MSKYGVFSGPYSPLFGLNTEIYFENLRIQPDTVKYGPENLDTFHAVELILKYTVFGCIAQ